MVKGVSTVLVWSDERFHLQSSLTLSDVADFVNRLLTVCRLGRAQGPLIIIVPVRTITGSPLYSSISKSGTTSCFSLDTGPALGYRHTVQQMSVGDGQGILLYAAYDSHSLARGFI
jgi:hypothetical protein